MLQQGSTPQRCGWAPVLDLTDSGMLHATGVRCPKASDASLGIALSRDVPPGDGTPARAFWAVITHEDLWL